MRIAILHDRIGEKARKDELDTLEQVAAVSNALSALGHEPSSLAFSFALKKTMAALRRVAPDLVFNLVESVEGHGRLIAMAPAILDAMKIPYTGAPTEAIFLTSNKLVAKKMLTGVGIASPPWFSLDTLPGPDVALEGRWIIKSVWEHASVGLDEDSVVEVKSADELRREMKRRAPQVGGEAFAESSTEIVTVCPSTTGTRLQCALTLAVRSRTRLPSKSPRIFCVSCCIFSSSPPMNGITLPTMSMDATPG
jgi:D-alanine-D-alanine ligase